MLPAGLTADPLPWAEQQALGRVHPATRTGIRLLVGACSCDLVRPRLPHPLEDERELRARYRALGVPREGVIRALERHRRGAERLPPSEGWPQALAAFVAEHARNAGPSLYHLGFAPHPSLSLPPVPPAGRSAAEVRARPREWLAEGAPTLVR